MDTAVHEGNRMVGGRHRRAVLWLTCIAGSAVLGLLAAVLVNSMLFGRLPLASLIGGWFGSLTLTSVSLAVTVWWIAYTRIVIKSAHGLRASTMLVPAAPILLGTAVPLFAIYASDAANHYFYYSMVYLSQPKSLTILLILVVTTILLQTIYLEKGRETALLLAAQEGIRRAREALIVCLLVALGALQATAYLPPPGMDFSRYWIVADGLGAGIPYAANTTVDNANAAAGMTPFIIDLPLYPAMMAIAFALFGHNVAAGYFPIIVANIVLPALIYLLFRELVPHRALAVTLTGLLALFPLLRFYTLNFPVPDSIFLAMLMLCSWMLVKIVKGGGSIPLWMMFGASAAAAALVRTEGVAYVCIYVIVAISTPATWRQRASGLATFLLPMGTFSLITLAAFGTPWPRTFVNTLSIDNIQGNLPVLVADEFFMSAIRLSSLQLVVGWGVLLILALLGSLPNVHRPRRLSMLFVPAWINLFVVYMANPRVSGARLWFDFFRHVSYVLPLFVLGAGVALAFAVARVQEKTYRLLALVVLNALLFAGVMWEVQALSKPAWNFGPDAVNVLSQDRVNLIDYVIHPFELPKIEYELLGGHGEPVFPQGFMLTYPDPLIEFYGRYDAVKQMTGIANQTGSLFTYLAALALALLPVRTKHGMETWSGTGPESLTKKNRIE